MIGATERIGPTEERQRVSDQALGAIERIRDIIVANADAAEEDRRVPDAVWKAIDEAGLFRLKAPRELGGWEADPVVQIEAIARMAYLDTSAGWTLMVGCGDQGIVGGWAPDAALDVFTDAGVIQRGAVAFAPTGTAEVVDGGISVTGRWQFASGIHHADWIAAMAVPQGAADDAPTLPRMFIVPASSVEILDTWFVGGLKGTGSCDFTVDGIFVPEDHTFDPLGTPARGGAVYQFGLPGFVAIEHAAFALGAGRRAIDEMIELAKSKVRGFAKPQGVAAREHFQWELGYHDVKLRAAHDYVVSRTDAAWQAVLAGDTLTDAQQLELRITAAHATLVAHEAAQAMFRHAGAKSLFTGNITERCLRDLNAAAQHQICNDIVFEAHGRVLLGYPNVSPYS